ncbi:hypothetical protein ACGFYU_05775 [Streptomyces sp. NPDC048337]|uniref:hypothetical protein n=1 Tax=Streptomyces sp. NPDC048337 TaxID=3365535 RepID=UPI00371D6012
MATKPRDHRAWAIGQDSMSVGSVGSTGRVCRYQRPAGRAVHRVGRVRPQQLIPSTGKTISARSPTIRRQSRKELAAARASEDQTAFDRLIEIFDEQVPGALLLR